MSELDMQKAALRNFAAQHGIKLPYSVKLETHLGGYLRFCGVERGISNFETAKLVAESYAETARANHKATFKAVHVFEDSKSVHVITL